MTKSISKKTGAGFDCKPINNFFKTNTTQVVTFFVLIALCLALTVFESAFLTPKNLINVVLQVSVIGILAVGMSFVIFSGGIDLSVGSIMALCSTVLGDMVVNKGINSFLSIIVCLLLGITCGALSGLLIAKVKMPPFIVTMGAMSLYRGIALEYVHGVGIYGVPKELSWLGAKYTGAIPNAVILMLILFLVAWFILKKTSFGMHTYALGDNEKASKLSGIKVNRVKVVIYAISGFMCAIAAIVATGRMGGTTPIIGSGYELEAIAGVAIGGASMSGGVGSIWGTLIGVLIVQVIRNGMNMLSLSPYYQQIIIGVIIIISVGIDCFRRRKAD